VYGRPILQIDNKSAVPTLSLQVMIVKHARWGLVAVLLMATACGNPPTVTGGASPSSGASPSAAASPTASPVPADRLLALVTLKGSSQLVVRDITDIAHPTTVAKLPPLSAPQFINASEISYVDYAHGTIVRMPLSGSPKTVVAQSSQLGGYVDWSPDGTTVIYTTHNADSTVMQLHQVGAGQDRVLASMPAVPGVGCESVASCPTDVWDARLLYSRDGNFISFVNSIVKPTFRLWSSDGAILKSTDSGLESMSVWSGSTLYFRDAHGVEAWHNGVISPFLPGVAWVRPKASSDGKRIAYQVRDPQRWSHVYVVDTTSGRVSDLGKAHAEPALLTSRYLWYLGERACVAADGCGTRVAGVPNGTTYIYDLTDKTQSTSVITSVVDVWPHAA
jgi:hypothetical protein